MNAFNTVRLSHVEFTVKDLAASRAFWLTAMVADGLILFRASETGADMGNSLSSNSGAAVRPSDQAWKGACDDRRGFSQGSGQTRTDPQELASSRIALPQGCLGRGEICSWNRPSHGLFTVQAVV